MVAFLAICDIFCSSKGGTAQWPNDKYAYMAIGYTAE